MTSTPVTGRDGVGITNRLFIGEDLPRVHGNRRRERVFPLVCPEDLRPRGASHCNHCQNPLLALANN